MRLSWNTDLQDKMQTDNALKEMKRICEDHSRQKPDRMHEDDLLNHMEMLVDLMQQYYEKQDMRSLEWTMREFERCLKVCEEKTLHDVGCWYLKMEFFRINGQLYQNTGNMKKGKESLEQSAGYAWQCVNAGRNHELTGTQILYLGSRCLEVYQIYLLLADIVQAPVDMTEILSEMYITLEWMEQYVFQLPSIADRVGDLYGYVGVQMNLHGNVTEGRRCLQKAVAIHHELYRKQNNITAYTKEIWISTQLYMLESAAGKDQSTMLLNLEEKAGQLLRENSVLQYQRGMLNGVIGNVELQKSLYFQSQGDLHQAAQFAEESCRTLKEALDILDKEQRNTVYDEQVCWMIKQTACQVYGNYLAVMQLRGTQRYLSGNMQEAIAVYEETLRLITDIQNYRISETLAQLSRADISEKLSDIYRRSGDMVRSEFYGKQAADTASLLFYQNHLDIACGIIVGSCTLLAEYYMHIREKEKALEYSEKGLQACDRLADIDPESGKLELRGIMLRIRRKCGKRFLVF